MKRNTPKHGQGMQHTHLVEYVHYTDILEFAASRGEKPFILVLDGIEDPRNFGAILRSAECAGVHGVIIPKRRSVQVTSTVEKTSTGAAHMIPISQVSNITQILQSLKKEGLWITGLDVTGQDYRSIDFDGGVVLVIGGEANGISRIVREECDFLAQIPMLGKIEALNASVAGSLVMYEVLRTRHPFKK